MKYTLNIFDKSSSDYMKSPFHMENGTSTIVCANKDKVFALLEKYKNNYPEVDTIAIHGVEKYKFTTLHCSWLWHRHATDLPDLV